MEIHPFSESGLTFAGKGVAVFEHLHGEQRNPLAVPLRADYGAMVADFQNTCFKLAEYATLAHVVRSFVNDCIQRMLDGTLDQEATYPAKWWCTEQQGKVTDECMQLFGGYGYMAEYPIARLYADARVQRIYGGTTEIMKDLIARKLLS